MPKRVADYIRESGDGWGIEDNEGTHIGTIFYSEKDRDFIFAFHWELIPICHQNDEHLRSSLERYSRNELKELAPHIVDRIVSLIILGNLNREYGGNCESHVEGQVRGWKNVYEDRLRVWKGREFAWLEVRKWLDLLVEE